MKIKYFHRRKFIWKCPLQYDVHFIQALIRWSAIISQSNKTLYYIQHCSGWQNLIRGLTHKRHPIPHPWGRVNYGVFIVRIWVKNCRIITAPHCMLNCQYSDDVIFFRCTMSVTTISSTAWSLALVRRRRTNWSSNKPPTTSTSYRYCQTFNISHTKPQNFNFLV